MAPPREAVLFDLLTALLDSWSLWDRVAGSKHAGRRWRAKYLEVTYGCGAYRPYETLVGEAALATGLTAAHAGGLASSCPPLPSRADPAKVPASIRSSTARSLQGGKG